MIDLETVKKVARLARLDLPEGEMQSLVEELSSILDFVQQLDALDVSQVPPLTHASGGTNIFREDRPTTPLDRAAALQNAPASHEGFFQVPRVVGEG